MEFVELSSDILNFDSKVPVDNSIEKKEYKTFIPQSKADFNQPNSTIEIKIPACDAYYIPSESYLEVKGQLVRNDNDAAYAEDAEISLINNAVMYMFDSIQYRLGGQVLETINYPGHTTSILGYLTYPDDFNSSSGLKQCWRKDVTQYADSNEFQTSQAVAADAAILAGTFKPRRDANYNKGFDMRRKLLMSANPRGSFSFVIPFSHIFGFSEYDKVLYNMEHLLKFTRASDTQAIHRANGVQDGKLKLTDLRWCIREVVPNPVARQGLMELIKNKSQILLHFSARSDDHTIVNDNVRTYDWMLNASAGIEKPRFIIVGLQTNRTSTQEQNPAVFDHLNLSSACVKLNGDRYPTDYLDIDFARNDYTKLYEMCEVFKREHFSINNLIGCHQIDFLSFKKLFPILVFDVRHQSEQLRSNVMSIKIELKFDAAVPAQTHLYAVIISDRIFRLTSDGQTPRMETF